MARTTNARLAGVTIFFSIAAGVAALVLAGRARVTDLLSMLIKGVASPLQRQSA